MEYTILYFISFVNLLVPSKFFLHIGGIVWILKIINSLLRLVLLSYYV